MSEGKKAKKKLSKKLSRDKRNLNVIMDKIILI